MENAKTKKIKDLEHSIWLAEASIEFCEKELLRIKDEKRIKELKEKIRLKNAKIEFIQKEITRYAA